MQKKKIENVFLIFFENICATVAAAVKLTARCAVKRSPRRATAACGTQHVAARACCVAYFAAGAAIYRWPLFVAYFRAALGKGSSRARIEQAACASCCCCCCILNVAISCGPKISIILMIFIVHLTLH